MDEEDRRFWPPKGGAWVAIGAGVGLVAGAAFGPAYAAAGLAIGLAGGAAIWLALR